MSEMIARSGRDGSRWNCGSRSSRHGRRSSSTLTCRCWSARCGTRGLAVETPCWDDPGIDWTRYGAALLRSTWDYVDRIDEFLDWCDRCAARTRLLNPPDVVRWNTDKHYLPTSRVPACRSCRLVSSSRARMPAPQLEAFPRRRRSVRRRSVIAGDFEEFVVKPAIGAGSRDARATRAREAGRAHATCSGCSRPGAA